VFVKNQWYVAGWDNEIDQAPVARIICGEPIVFYRKFDRTVVGLRDACPHRLLPLSLGIKEGDNIRCRYHGLLINSAGQAVEMPVRTACSQKYLHEELSDR
jgi:vanillate monooxygenase